MRHANVAYAGAPGFTCTAGTTHHAPRHQQLNLSRALFAGYLRTNVRTLENWEQGRAQPNAQAALLIRLVQRFPDTVNRLAEI